MVALKPAYPLAISMSVLQIPDNKTRTSVSSSRLGISTSRTERCLLSTRRANMVKSGFWSLVFGLWFLVFELITKSLQIAPAWIRPKAKGQRPRTTYSSYKHSGHSVLQFALHQQHSQANAIQALHLLRVLQEATNYPEGGSRIHVLVCRVEW